MGLHSEEEVTVTFPTTRHPIAIPAATLARLDPPSGYSFGSTFAPTFPAGTYHFTPDEVKTFYEINKK